MTPHATRTEVIKTAQNMVVDTIKDIQQFKSLTDTMLDGSVDDEAHAYRQAVGILEDMAATATHAKRAILAAMLEPSLRDATHITDADGTKLLFRGRDEIGIGFKLSTQSGESSITVMPTGIQRNVMFASRDGASPEPFTLHHTP